MNWAGTARSIVRLPDLRFSRCGAAEGPHYGAPSGLSQSKSRPREDGLRFSLNRPVYYQMGEQPFARRGWCLEVVGMPGFEEFGLLGSRGGHGVGPITDSPMATGRTHIGILPEHEGLPCRCQQQRAAHDASDGSSGIAWHGIANAFAPCAV